MRTSVSARRIHKLAGRAPFWCIAFWLLATASYAQNVIGWGDNSHGQTTIPPQAANAIAVAAGKYHSLALNADGTVVAWGKNVDGQTNVPVSATNVVAIAAGGNHSLALTANGSVLAWGRDWDGQIDVPVLASNVAAIAAGSAHSLALRADGSVVAWGNDDYGQTDVPVRATKVIAIAAGYYHNLALRSDNTVVAWGLQDTVPTGLANIVGISAGWWHSLAADAHGRVTAWGDNSYGQCDVPSDATNVIAVAAGYNHSLALRSDGTVVAWGAGYHGETSVPPGLGNVVSIAAGEDFSLALVELGPPRAVDPSRAVLGHAAGQIILTANLPGESPMSFQWFYDGQLIAGATNRDYVATNLSSSDAGTYTVVASNAVGQTTNQPVTLSVGVAPYFASDPAFQNVPIGGNVCLTPQVLGAPSLSYQWQLNGINLADGARVKGANSAQLCLQGAQPADSGAYTLVASNTDGVVTGTVAQVSVTDLVAWGDDSSGQIEVPFTATNIVAFAAGGDHNLAARQDGTVIAWGDDSVGQCDVPGSATNVISVAAGALHSLALRADGSVIAWGGNTYGQTNVPAFPTTVAAIAAGAYYSVAQLASGNLVAWGAYQSGQTNTIFVFGPIAIAAGGDQGVALLASGHVQGWGVHAGLVPGSLTNAIAIAAGASHGLALRTNGAVVGWGDNYYSQISIPAFNTNVIAIGAGDDHSLAALADGTVVGWGANYSGQISAPALRSVSALSAGRAHSLALLGPAVALPSPVFEFQPPSLTFSNGAFQLRLGNLTGQGISVILASTNLVDWEPIHYNIPKPGSLDFVDPRSNSLPQRFYRAYEQR